MIYSRTRFRCRRVLEHIFRVHSAEVLESVIECWGRETTVCLDAFLRIFAPSDYKQTTTNESNASFELIDVLIASAQNAVHMICESISCRTSGNKKRAVNPHL